MWKHSNVWSGPILIGRGLVPTKMLRVHCEVSRDTVETPPTSAPFGVVRLGLGGPYRHLHRVSVIKALGKHPAPFRTRKLSLSAPMVLHGGPCGRLGRRRTTHHLRVNHTCWLTLRCFHVHPQTHTHQHT